MPFNRLLLCALEDDCSYNEQGVKVGLRTREGISAMLFKLATHVKESRKALDLKDSDRLCDLLFYAVSGKRAETQRVLCFVECKGTDVPHAIKQIAETAGAVHRKLERDLHAQVRFIGAVRSQHGSSPRQKPKRSELGPLEYVKVCRTNSQLEDLIVEYLDRGSS